ncbi:MAG: hypothetical protein QNI89_00740 [Desulfobacterales bacterium]|nr:hypothetical protein [Desulfobacterales bacterium]MDJ0856629.1 hypothetical protein [Desulfobacterales bacterium]MDJ0885786.1 hypothetical protein [Desulfobacterales bacterium]MDJ0990661.1 hypothetical protein [Desulfobacterales bacterium]
MSEVVKRQVCKCENCGNEAEMVITCSLPDEEPQAAASKSPATPEAPPSQKVKGQGTCTHCGNEADMWVDL